MHQGDRIFCTGPGPPATFSPETEVAVTFSVPAPRDKHTYWAAWHAKSQWLTVCVARDWAGNKYNYRRPPLESWGDLPPTELGFYTLTTWDTANNRVVDVRDVHSDRPSSWPLGFLLKVWTCGDEVWMAFVATDVGPASEQFELTLVHYVPGKTPADPWGGRWLRDTDDNFLSLPLFRSSIACLSVSEESGQLAFVRRYWDEQTGSHHAVLHFYDVRERRSVVVEWFISHDDRDTVLLSPCGSRMVYVRNSSRGPEITVYARVIKSEEGTLGWIRSKCTPPDRLGVDLPRRAMRLTSEAFSPCGSRALFLWESENNAIGLDGVFVVDLLKTEHSNRVEVEWHDWHSETVPSQLAWSEDGLFARTASMGGVLRVGLVA